MDNKDKLTSGDLWKAKMIAMIGGLSLRFPAGEIKKKISEKIKDIKDDITDDELNKILKDHNKNNKNVHVIKTDSSSAGFISSKLLDKEYKRRLKYFGKEGADDFFNKTYGKSYEFLSGKDVVKSSNVEAILRHELGHAKDLKHPYLKSALRGSVALPAYLALAPKIREKANEVEILKKPVEFYENNPFLTTSILTMAPKILREAGANKHALIDLIRAHGLKPGLSKAKMLMPGMGSYVVGALPKSVGLGLAARYLINTEKNKK